MNKKLKEWTEFVRDTGLIIGVPILITIGVKLYGAQIDLMKAENTLLKQTQYDRAWSLMESQKNLFQEERKSLTLKISKLEIDKTSHKSNIEVLRDALEVVKIKLREIENKKKLATSGYCSPSITASGTVTINCYGISERALKYMNQLLENKVISLDEKLKLAEETVHTYNVLKQKMKEYDEQSGVIEKAQEVFDRGNFDMAKAILSQELESVIIYTYRISLKLEEIKSVHSTQ